MRLKADKVMEAAARITGVTAEQIRGLSRRSDIVAARHIAMWLARRLAPQASLAAIGRALGGRHHTTVMHGIRKVERASGELAELRDEALLLAQGMQREPEQAIMLDLDRACETLGLLIEQLMCIRARMRAIGQAANGGEASDGPGIGGNIMCAPL